MINQVINKSKSNKMVKYKLVFGLLMTQFIIKIKTILNFVLKKLKELLQIQIFMDYVQFLIFSLMKMMFIIIL